MTSNCSDHIENTQYIRLLFMYPIQYGYIPRAVHAQNLKNEHTLYIRVQKSNHRARGHGLGQPDDPRLPFSLLSAIVTAAAQTAQLVPRAFSYTFKPGQGIGNVTPITICNHTARQQDACSDAFGQQDRSSGLNLATP